MTIPDQFKGEYGQEKRVVMTFELAGYTKVFETKNDEPRFPQKRRSRPLEARSSYSALLMTSQSVTSYY